MSDAIDDFHDAVLKWAEHLGLEGDEQEEYVSFHMEKGGYKRATTWLPPDPEEGKQGGGGFMSGGKKRAATRPGPTQQQKRTPPSYFNQGGK